MVTTLPNNFSVEIHFGCKQNQDNGIFYVEKGVYIFHTSICNFINRILEKKNPLSRKYENTVKEMQ